MIPFILDRSEDNFQNRRNATRATELLVDYLRQQQHSELYLAFKAIATKLHTKMIATEKSRSEAQKLKKIKR